MNSLQQTKNNVARVCWSATTTDKYLLMPLIHLHEKGKIKGEASFALSFVLPAVFRSLFPHWSKFYTRCAVKKDVL